MAEKYAILNKASIDQHFLKSNSTCLNVFDAISEIVDNSRDARANSFCIFENKCVDSFGGWYVGFLDDGEGMEPADCEDVIRFGKSKKRLSLKEYVGRNGVGLKSSSFRLSQDLILFTKKNDLYSIVFWSQSFYKQCNCSDVIVAIPSFNKKQEPYYNPKRYYDNEGNEIRKHQLELELIFTYSPFKTVAALFEQFALIKSNTGTLVICYNLWLNNDGRTEFIIDNNNDLVLTSDSLDKCYLKDLPLEKRSYREYVSILYTDPKMKIYINDSKVRLKKFFYHLYMPYEYEYLGKNMFKKKVENDIKSIERELENIKFRLREARTNERNFNTKMNSLSDKDVARLKFLTNEKLRYEKQQREKEEQISAIEKSRKDPQLITIRFGVNAHNPKQSGFYIYNGVRLISTPDKLNKTLENTFLARGLVGIVIIPYSVMEPAQYKSDGLRTGIEKEILKLKKVLDDYLEQYLRDLKDGIIRNISREFEIHNLWTLFGYDPRQADFLPLQKPSPEEEKNAKRQRAIRAKTLIQCDSCLKWRVVPSDREFNSLKFPDDWKCSDFKHVVRGISCELTEKYDIEIKKGELKKPPEAKKKPNEDRRSSVGDFLTPSSSITSDSRNKSRGSVDVEAIRNPMRLFQDSRDPRNSVSNSRLSQVSRNQSLFQRMPSLSRSSLSNDQPQPMTSREALATPSFTSDFNPSAHDSSSDFENDELFSDQSANTIGLEMRKKKKRPRDNIDRTYQPPKHIRRSVLDIAAGEEATSSAAEEATTLRAVLETTTTAGTAKLPIVVNTQLSVNAQVQEPEDTSQSDGHSYGGDTDAIPSNCVSFQTNEADSTLNEIETEMIMEDENGIMTGFLKHILIEIDIEDRDFTNFTSRDICRLDVPRELTKFLTFIKENFKAQLKKKDNRIKEKDEKIQELQETIEKLMKNSTSK